MVMGMLHCFSVMLCIFSCTDFQSWNSVYEDRIVIAFKQEEDPDVPGCPKYLTSVKLADYPMDLCPLQPAQKRKEITLTKNAKWSIPLMPNENYVSFLIKDDYYYHRVTVFYDRIASLISPQAGGLQQKYTITRVIFTTKDGRLPIFNRYQILQATPLNTDKQSVHHVVLYY